VSQSECDHANALREYESAHKVWMNTSVFTDAGKEARRVKDEARVKYETAAQSVLDERESRRSK
jgi:hypothetical protein